MRDVGQRIGQLRLAERAARTVTGALRWPRSVFFLPVAIGGVFISLFSVRMILEDIVRWKDAA